jgi:hypothetical protein
LLLVPAERPTAAAGASLEKAVFTVVPQGRTFYHTVRRGETIQSIAVRYGVTIGEIREWNSLARASVSTGQQIRVTSDARKATSRQQQSAPRLAAGRSGPANVGRQTRGGHERASRQRQMPQRRLSANYAGRLQRRIGFRTQPRHVLGAGASVPGAR